MFFSTAALLVCVSLPGLIKAQDRLLYHVGRDIGFGSGLSERASCVGTCVSCYGAGAIACSSDSCYDPTKGETCCSSGKYCDAGYYCAPNPNYCCPSAQSANQCAVSQAFSIPASTKTSTSKVVAASVTSTKASTTVTTSSKVSTTVKTSSKVAATTTASSQAAATFTTSSSISTTVPLSFSGTPTLTTLGPSLSPSVPAPRISSGVVVSTAAATPVALRPGDCAAALFVGAMGVILAF